ncbi:hypothetical protein LCGC14_2806700, partial [marine sediment metagenome]
MASPWYTPGGVPGTSAFGSSSAMRGELVLIETAMDKLPTLTADYVVKVNPAGTALESVQYLDVVQGGTGVGTFTDGGILLGA